jgi:hypothetical protein
LTRDDHEFTRTNLVGDGFEGWATFEALKDQLDQHVPTAGGVYVVVRQGRAAAQYLDANPGGRFKSRDPTVRADALEANWVRGANVIYIGKADNLRRRLREFMRFGQGAPIGHWGGRLIWQLADSARLLVAWKATPGEIPREAEADMIDRFRAAYGKPPFANEPHRLGQ